MKTVMTVGLLGVFACSLGVYAGPKEDVLVAAKKLNESGFSWKSTMDYGANSQFQPGPTEGKYAKDGTFCVSTTMGENTMMAFRKGEKAVVKTEDGWKTPEEMRAAAESGGDNRRGFGGLMMSGVQSPTTQIENLVAGAKELKESGGAISADFTEDGAKKLLSFGRGRGGPGGAGAPGGGQAPPEPKNAKGFVKFWVKDGAVVKYMFNVTGTRIGRNNNETEVDRTTTVEIKDVGSTKLDVPEEVKKKL